MSILNWFMELICAEKERLPWRAFHSGPGLYWVSYRTGPCAVDAAWTEPVLMSVFSDDLVINKKGDYEIQPNKAELWIDIHAIGYSRLSIKKLSDWVQDKETRWLADRKPNKPTW